MHVDAQGCRTYLQMERKLLEAAEKGATIICSPGNMDLLYQAAGQHIHTRNVRFEVRGTHEHLMSQLKYVV